MSRPHGIRHHCSRIVRRSPGDLAVRLEPVGYMTTVDTANDLSHILLVIMGTVGSIVALLFLLAAVEPPTTKSRQLNGTHRIASRTPARTDRENAPHHCQGNGLAPAIPVTSPHAKSGWMAQVRPRPEPLGSCSTGERSTENGSLLRLVRRRRNV